MTEGGYILDKGTIVLHRSLTSLDMFVKKFVNILQRHTEYLIVSGYVSIVTGRTRGTEDVDVLIPVPEKGIFTSLFLDLTKHGFWCYQGDGAEEVYRYPREQTSVRFALKDQMFPNIELVPFGKEKRAKAFEFSHPQKMRIDSFEFKVPPIEFEILYKEMVLAGKKDLEDARHLRVFFKDMLDINRFKQYRIIIENDSNRRH